MYRKVYELIQHSRTRRPEKTVLEKIGTVCNPDQCYGAAFGVLRPPTVNKHMSLSLAESQKKKRIKFSLELSRRG